MVMKPSKEDAIRDVLNAKAELLIELERCILAAERMNSSVQHTLKRVRTEVNAIYAPLHKQFENTLE